MVFNTDMAREIASDLLKIKAVKLRPSEPFTWTSGWKAPIYCDNRKALSYPDIRNKITAGLVDVIRNHFGEVQAIAGVATAGIPQGAIIADRLKLPLGYVRDKAKGHGLQNRIEGDLQKGHKIVVVEDLVSTARSSLGAVEALKSDGHQVIGMVANFTYGFAVSENTIKNSGLPFYALSDYVNLIEVAIEQHLIDQSQLDSLMNWRSHPEAWKP
jgi:orotate phosphoribosyltransferase